MIRVAKRIQSLDSQIAGHNDDSSILWKDAIVASNNKDEARALLRCSAPLVARVKRNREFISLIDRVSLLDEAMNKISDKLEARD